MKLTISKALKKKNLLAKEINELYARLQSQNSYIAANKPSYNSSIILDEIAIKEANLISLKTAIHLANGKVYDKIFRLSEIKSKVQKLRNIPTHSGMYEPSSFRSDAMVTYECQITKVMLDSMIKNFEKEIETIQDELDEHNATKKIEIDFE